MIVTASTIAPGLRSHGRAPNVALRTSPAAAEARSRPLPSITSAALATPVMPAVTFETVLVAVDLTAPEAVDTAALAVSGFGISVGLDGIQTDSPSNFGSAYSPSADAAYASSWSAYSLSADPTIAPPSAAVMAAA